jgi:hypothetical protein
MAEGLTPYGDTENWREVFQNARRKWRFCNKWKRYWSW